MNDSDNTGAKRLLASFTNFVDNNIRVIKYIAYGIGLTGVIIIGRSIHITKQFSKVQEIPIEFISKGIKLNTVVKSCDDSGILLVRHVPILKTFKKKYSESLLPVHLVGIEHDEESISWLSKTVVGKPLWCDVLRVNQKTNHLDCSVYCKLGWFRQKCLNEYLVQQGLAKFIHDETFALNGGAKHERYVNLLQKLILAEIYAQNKGKGMWKNPTLIEVLKAYPYQVKDKIISTLPFRRKK